MKPCTRGKIPNPNTGRCVKKSGSIGRRIRSARKCPSNKIVNPETNRCVKKSGSIGRALIANKRRRSRRSSRSSSRRSSSRRSSRKSSSSRKQAGKILNPETGRMVKRTGEIGRRILQHQASSSSSSYAPTPPRPTTAEAKQPTPPRKQQSQNNNDEANLGLFESSIDDSISFELPERNQRTPRVNMTTQDAYIQEAKHEFGLDDSTFIDDNPQVELGSRRQQPTRRAKNPRKPIDKSRAVSNKYGANALKVIPSGYYVSKLLGAGTNETYRLCSVNAPYRCNLAIKYIKRKTEELREEQEMGEKFHSLSIGPEISETGIFRGKGGKKVAYIVMRQIDGLMDDWLAEPRSREELTNLMSNIDILIRVMNNNDLVHGDLHWGNLGYDIFIRSTQQYMHPILIDFGLSEQRPRGSGGMPGIEYVKLANDIIEPIHTRNRKILTDLLYERTQRYYPELRRGPAAARRKYDILFDIMMDERHTP